jgi:outer membrane immunogenic protein
MKRVLLVGTAIAALMGGPALAADMPLKAPVAAPSYYNWSGFYGSFGAGWARSDMSWHLTNPAPPTLPPFSASTDDTILGFNVGYQRQFNWLVLGVDAGVSTFVNRPVISGPVGGGPGGCTVNGGQLCQVSLSQSIRTVGGKLGVAWNDWLFYGEGGGAWAQVRTRFFTPPGSVFDPLTQERHGWYAGGGIDHVLLRGPLDLIAGVEYRHVDLGDHFVQSIVDGGPNGPNSRFIGAKVDSVMGRLTLKWNSFPW